VHLAESPAGRISFGHEGPLVTVHLTENLLSGIDSHQAFLISNTSTF